MVVNTGDNRWATSNFIVAPTIAEGAGYTTIAAALTAASSGNTIFIKPGTYTENLTLKAGVNLCAFACDSYTPNVIILGKCTATFAGTCTISGIQLKTNSDFCLSVTGSSATLINLKGCFIDANNNNAIQFTSSSGSSKIQLYDCKGDIDTTGIAYFTHSGAGALKFFGGVFENNGASTTASTSSGSGGLNFYNLFFSNAITTSSTSSFAANNVQFYSYPLIINGTGTNQIFTSYVGAGASSALSIGAGAILLCNDCNIDSTNTNAITGAGTLQYSGLTFSNTSSIINTTTQTALYGNLGKYKASGQPAFSTTLSGAVNDVTGDGTTYTIAFNSEIFDQDSNVSGSTFTAPVTGRYHLNAIYGFDQLGASHSTIDLIIVTSNRSYIQLTSNPNNLRNGGLFRFNGIAFADMDAADTSTITVNVSGSTKTVDVTTTTFFGGYLAC